MIRKIFKTGNREVICLPSEMLKSLGVGVGSDVNIELDSITKRITISSLEVSIHGVNEEFARHVSEFIQEYRPVLEALAR